MNARARVAAVQPVPSVETTASAPIGMAYGPNDDLGQQGTPSFAQLEKLLMIAAFDPAFAERIVDYGDTAKTRYAFEDAEGQLLDCLLAHRAAGLRAVQNVLRAVIETCAMLRGDDAGGLGLGAHPDAIRQRSTLHTGCRE